ncbi:MAG: FAD binding domain-containing protein [Rhodovarius sp.]|nr:FAD binding domain-containing protein [Rhodovarius sp.]MDW8316017.1 FAD binding domain-containing protein [Rhodovarius sp.]
MQETRIAFTLNGQPRLLPAGTSPTRTLLDWLREEARLTGTKEGCAEGDCGACTVVLEEGSRRRPINACLATLGQMHGLCIRTVEGLNAGRPHPVAEALAAADGTQCGFCTPGIVMAAWAWTREGGDPHEALAGNLCRCTGYRPILAAMSAMRDDGATAPPAAPHQSSRFTAAGQVFYLPASLAEAVALKRAHPEAWLLAGGTDLGLRFSEGREVPGCVIALSRVAELRGIARDAAGLRIGAAEPFETLLAACRTDPDFAPLAPYLARLGSRQIRAMGSLGGNLGTASPIGDALPILLALDAEVETSARRLPVAELLIDYRRTALGPDEIIAAIRLPRPAPGALLAAEKLSRRYDQDISAVSMVACLDFAEGVVARARIAFGGMAATARRARRVEAALTGRPLTREAARTAAALLSEEFTPLTDWRGSASWRLAAAGGLIERLWLRHAHPELPAEVMEVSA